MLKKEEQEDMISIICPCYNEEESIENFYNSTIAIINKLPIDDYEFVFIDDGSTDSTSNILEVLNNQDKRVKFVSFSRNFGKEAGMFAGLEYAKGEIVVLMDVDLQDPPELLIDMMEIILQGEFDCVATRRISRTGEPLIRSFFANKFYKIINLFSDIQIIEGARDFRMMTRKMVDAILNMKETNRFSKGIFSWVGFKTKWLEYKNIERTHGQTKWSFKKLFIYALDGIASFSTIPLVGASFLGLFACCVSICLTVFFVVQKFIGGIHIDGWASMICIILFIGGVQLSCIGILGYYIAKMFIEVKRRPIYIVKKQVI